MSKLTTQPRLLSIEELNGEIEHLHQQNRFVRKTGCVLLIIIMSAIIGGAHEDRGGKIVEAEEFVLRDKQGNLRAVLGVNREGSTSFTLFDRDQKLRHGVSVPNDGGFTLYVRDKNNGSAVISMDVAAGISTGLQLSSANTKTKVSCLVLDVASSIQMSDRNGKDRVLIQEGANGPIIKLLDEKGKPAKAGNAAIPLAIKSK